MQKQELKLPLTDGCLFIDNSTIEKLITCPRSFEYYKLLNREASASRPALRFGDAIHQALELRYKTPGFNREFDEEDQIELLRDLFTNNPNMEEGYRNLDTAINCIRRYNETYQKDDFAVVQLSDGLLVERPFARPLCTIHSKRLNADIPIIYTGRIDLVVAASGCIFTLDHKTTSMLGDSFFDAQNMSAQHLGYMWATNHELGQMPNGFVVNALAVRAPSKTGKQFEFVQQRYYKTAKDVSEWYTNACNIMEEIVFYYDRGYFPMKTQWCVGKYGRCPYLPVCELPASNRAEMLRTGGYQEVTWSPLNPRGVAARTEVATEVDETVAVRMELGGLL